MTEYPEDTIQNLAQKWWEKDVGKHIGRGALVWAYVQYFSQVPLELVPERSEPENHKTAILNAKPLYAGGRKSAAASLPVAGMPRLEGADCFIANRAKKRPCLVIGAVDQVPVEFSLTYGMTKAATHQFFLVAPYYSTEQAARGGYNPEFVERIMHAEYSRFFWDVLPGSFGHESVLRLDQIQPVGFHHQAYEPCGYKLSREALMLMDEWLNWLIYGVSGENITLFKELIQSPE